MSFSLRALLSAIIQNNFGFSCQALQNIGLETQSSPYLGCVPEFQRGVIQPFTHPSLSPLPCNLLRTGCGSDEYERFAKDF